MEPPRKRAILSFARESGDPQYTLIRVFHLRSSYLVRLPTELRVKILRNLDRVSVLALHRAYPDQLPELTPIVELIKRGFRSVWPLLIINDELDFDPAIMADWYWLYPAGGIILRGWMNLHIIDQIRHSMAVELLHTAFSIDANYLPRVWQAIRDGRVWKLSIRIGHDVKDILPALPGAFDALAGPGNQVRELSFADFSDGQESLKGLMSALNGPFCKVTELSFSLKGLRYENAQALARFLKSSYCRVKELSLKHCRIDQRSFAVLGTAFQSHSCPVTSLH